MLHSALNKLPFPTVSSLLHIRKKAEYWPFLEKSGPQKWVVGATLVPKQNFLAGTLKYVSEKQIILKQTYHYI